MIFLVDTIGIETGLHHYDAMFVESFKKAGKEVLTLSNYEDAHAKHFIYNFYHGGFIKKVFLLALSVIKLSLFSLSHRGDTFVYQSFGLRKIDQVFFVLIFCQSKYLLAHDVFDIKDVDRSGAKRRNKEMFYRNRIKQVICHSDKAEDTLLGFGYKGKIVKFPHFSYNYDELVNKFNEKNVGDDVKSAIASESIKFLFFGQLRETKGVSVLLQAIRLLDGVSGISIIVAGTDKDRLIQGEYPPNIHLILRYMNDDEMVYLYSHSDYLLLPYLEVYQSGVLESMLYFKKPGIMSDVDYFTNICRSFPSFGICYSPNEGEVLAKTISDIVNGVYDDMVFYKAVDREKYIKSHDVTKIIEREF